MKILLVTHGFPPDQMAGAEIHAYHLARGLIESGAEVSVFSPGLRDGLGPYEVATEDVDGIRVLRMHNDFSDLHRLETTYSNPRVNEVWRRILADERPDVVHVHHVIGTSVDVIPIARDAGIPVIVTLHDFWFHCARGQRMTPRHHLCTEVQPWRCALCVGKKRGRYAFDWTRDWFRGRTPESAGVSLLMRVLAWLPRAIRYGFREAGVSPIRRRLAAMSAALDRANLVTSPSEFLRDEFLRRGFPPERLVFSENGMETSRFADLEGVSAARADRPEGVVRFGFVGTLIPTKGPDLLVDAFRDMPHDRATLDVWGAGGGPNGPRYAAALEVASSHPGVTFRGRFDNKDIARVLGAIDVLVVPSRWYENAPLTLHEAAVARIPVVTSDHGGMKEFAERFGTAEVFTPGDAASLTRAMMRYVDDPGLLERNAAPRRPVRTMDDDVEKTLARYRELIT